MKRQILRTLLNLMQPYYQKQLDWLLVAGWSVIIFATVPIARDIRKSIAANYGTGIFIVLVTIFLVIMTLWGFRTILQKPEARGSRSFWLIAVLTAYAWYTYQLRANPEEALHFIEYGMLGLLLFRALLHDMRDLFIYPSAAIAGGIIGAMDEAIQWLTPGRIWAMDDIGLNFVAVTLMQLGIARTIRPARVAMQYTAAGLTRCRNLALSSVFIITLCLLNTPERISAYSQALPPLRFLIENGSVMAEYGHLIKVPAVGVFRSRMSGDELLRADSLRQVLAARVLQQEGPDDNYSAFLQKYSPVTDAFLHELRVHLFRRDRYYRKALTFIEDDPGESRRRLTIAFYENEILERFFGKTLAVAGLQMSAEQLEVMRANMLPDFVYDSPVSDHLITRISEREAILGILLLAALICAGDLVMRRQLWLTQ